MKIAAFDLSLTQTGWATWSGATPDDGIRLTGVVKPPARGMERLAAIRAAVVKLSASADLVVLEGYSFGSKGAAVVNLGELGGVVRLALWERRTAAHPPAFVEVPPSVLKKYATGRGNAAKEDVLVAAVRRLGYEGSNHNEADALWLLHAAADVHGAGWATLPQAQRDALSKVAWR